MARPTVRNLQEAQEATIRPQEQVRDGFFLSRPSTRTIGALDFASLSRTLERGLLAAEERQARTGILEGQAEAQEYLASLTEEQRKNKEAFARAVAQGKIDPSGNPYRAIAYRTVLARGLVDRYGEVATELANQKLTALSSRGAEQGNAGVPPSDNLVPDLQAAYESMFREAARVNPELADDFYFRREVSRYRGEIDRKILQGYANSRRDAVGEVTGRAWEAEVSKALLGIAEAVTPEQKQSALSKLAETTNEIRQIGQVHARTSRAFQTAYNNLIAKHPETGAAQFLEMLATVRDKKITGTQAYGDSPEFSELNAKAAARAEQDAEAADRNKQIKIANVITDVDYAPDGVGTALWLAESAEELDAVEARIRELGGSNEQFAGERMRRLLNDLYTLRERRRSQDATEDARFIAEAQFLMATGDKDGAAELLKEIGDDTERARAALALHKMDEARLKEQVWDSTIRAQREATVVSRTTPALLGLPQELKDDFNQETASEIQAINVRLGQMVNDGASDEEISSYATAEFERLAARREAAAGKLHETRRTETDQIREELFSGATVDSIADRYTILQNPATLRSFQREQDQIAATGETMFRTIESRVRSQIEAQVTSSVKINATTGEITGDGASLFERTGDAVSGFSFRLSAAGSKWIDKAVQTRVNERREFYKTPEGRALRLKVVPTELTNREVNDIVGVIQSSDDPPPAPSPAIPPPAPKDPASRKVIREVDTFAARADYRTLPKLLRETFGAPDPFATTTDPTDPEVVGLAAADRIRAAMTTDTSAGEIAAFDVNVLVDDFAAESGEHPLALGVLAQSAHRLGAIRTSQEFQDRLVKSRKNFAKYLLKNRDSKYGGYRTDSEIAEAYRAASETYFIPAASIAKGEFAPGIPAKAPLRPTRDLAFRSVRGIDSFLFEGDEDAAVKLLDAFGVKRTPATGPPFTDRDSPTFMSPVPDRRSNAPWGYMDIRNDPSVRAFIRAQRALLETRAINGASAPQNP